MLLFPLVQVNIVSEFQHFWTLCSNYYCGGLKLEVLPDCDPKYIIRCVCELMSSCSILTFNPFQPHPEHFPWGQCDAVIHSGIVLHFCYIFRYCFTLLLHIQVLFYIIVIYSGIVLPRCNSCQIHLSALPFNISMA